MDTISLANFKKEVEQISQYIQHIEYVDSVIKHITMKRGMLALGLYKLKTHTKKHDRSKKKVEYKAIIISLYGLLERYIEIWVKDYLNAISSLAPYNELPNKIKVSHFKLSTKLISMLIEERWDKYDFLSKEEVLKNLYNCTENQPNYKLNAEAFTTQSGNLKHNKIALIFDNLDIKLNDKLIENEALNQITGIDTKRISGTKKDLLYFIINDIVDRRNRTAHGAEIDDLLDNPTLITYIDFLEKYCQAIFEVLMQEYLRLESTHKFQQIEVVHKVWEKSTLGFEIERYTVSQGDMLIIETTEGRFYKKPILELQKENVQYASLSITDKTNIAIRVEPPINNKCKFYIERK